MAGYSSQEEDQIIRDYFGPPGGEENPRCPGCGKVLRFDLDYATVGNRLRLRVSCSECATSFIWQQPHQEQTWKPLHLQYFVERYRMGQTIRCPVDDCYISYAEFTSGVLEFRCAYCNHRGKLTLLDSPGQPSTG